MASNIRQIGGRLLSRLPPMLVHGGSYRRVTRLLRDSIGWTPQQVADFQFLKTRQILDLAFNHTRWYANRFAEFGVTPADFKAPEDIRRFPTLSKEELRDNLQSLVVDLADTGKVEYVTTGGSTGVPVGFYQSVNLRGVERAFFRFQWKPYGVTPSDLSVVLRGAYVGSEAKPIRYFVRVHEWHLSIYQMTAARIPQYVRFINDVRPAFIQAYPSAVVPLAQYVLDNGLCMAGSLKAIMCGSENLYPNQKRLIENAFGVPVHSWYGQAEKVCLAVGEPGQEGLNVLPLYGLTELVSPTGGEASDRGASGEIVATSFWNDIVPFIRYKTGDIGIADDQDSASLYPTARRLERVEGRIHEYIVTGRGRVISMTAINMHDDIFDGIAYFRFYQDAPGHVELRVVPNAKFDRDLLSQIGTRIKAKLGDDCTVSVQCVDSLDRTSSGKFRFIEQHLSVDGYEKPGGDL